MNHRVFRLMLNLYPPYWGTGIVIKKVAPDFSEIVVEMKMRFYNRNYVNTHFGGSLYSMTDPFYMLMLIQVLGKDYLVWDRAAAIDFVKPGKGTVTATFRVDGELIADIQENTADGRKYVFDLGVDVKDQDGETVSRVTKTLYVRKKRP